jgi:quinol monooxygenase YgiN
LIVVVVELEFPAEARDQVLEVARALDVETNREPGCLHYRHAADLSRENALVLSEIWSDAEALLAHFRAPHFLAFRAAAAALGIRATIRQMDAEDVPSAEARHWKALLRASEAAP